MAEERAPRDEPVPPAFDDAQDTTAPADVSFLGPRILGVCILLLGLGVFVQTLDIGRSRGYSPVGPGFVPTVVAIGLIALAVAFLVRTTIRPDLDLGAQAAAEERATHWLTVGLIGAVLVGYALSLGGFSVGGLVIPGLGYPLATGLFVPLAARVLGSRSPLRDLLVGLAIGFIVWFGFTQALGVRLPSGVLGPILPGSG